MKRLKYRRGLEKEADMVYIGRAWGPFKQGSKWGNPFKSDRDGTIDEVLVKYELYIRSKQDLMNSLSELKNKTLICWCEDSKPCHGDVLIKLVNETNTNIQ